MTENINSIRKYIITLISILGGILLIGGVLVAVIDRSAETQFTLLSQKFNSTSVGVALAFIGAVIVSLTFRHVLKALDLQQSKDISSSDTQTKNGESAQIASFNKEIKNECLISENSNITLRIVQRFSNLSSNVIFAYGSLLDPHSLLSTLVRRDDTVECIPSRLFCHRRLWGVPQKRSNMIDSEWNSIEYDIYWQSLSIEKASNEDFVEGMLIGVDARELKELIGREKHYKLISVTEDIQTIDEDAFKYNEISTFFNFEKMTVPNNAKLVVRKDYYDKVSEYLKSIGFIYPLPIPERGEFIDAYEANDLMEKTLKRNEKAICQFATKTTNYLYDIGACWEVDGRLHVIPTAWRPIVLSRNSYTDIMMVAEIVTKLSIKALKLVLKNKEITKVSQYRPLDAQLGIDALKNITEMPQIVRVDISYNQGDIKVFEINCDSPGGMYHLDLITKEMQQFCSNKLGISNLDYRLFEDTCKTIKKTIFKTWNNFCERQGTPGRHLKNIAIVEHEWKRWQTKPEFLKFKSLLTENNTKAFICEPKELVWSGDELIHSEHGPVDFIYKRVLWKDLSKPELQEAEKMIVEAYRSNAICVVNSFHGRLVGNKFLLALIKDKKFKELLESIAEDLSELEENVIKNNIPWTKVWGGDEKLKETVFKNPGKYVIKSFFGFGGHDVFFGGDSQNWKDEFERAWNKNYIVQEVTPHGKVMVPEVKRDSVSWVPNRYMLGAYIIDGRPQSIEAKLAQTQRIGMSIEDGEPRGFRTAVFRTKF